MNMLYFPHAVASEVNNVIYHAAHAEAAREAAIVAVQAELECERSEACRIVSHLISGMTLVEKLERERTEAAKAKAPDGEAAATEGTELPAVPAASLDDIAF